MQLAIYGKGGIGKSTIAANLSAALALAGQRVLQVGCDPKRDSTRLLLRGHLITTVLDSVRTTPPGHMRLHDIVHAGFAGVHCLETGGPEPGVGCAGRGILTTFELLSRGGFDRGAYDVIIYDVLGDVVCGGFAVPLRRGYADVVYVVTSNEFMPIYAANNILRGIRSSRGAENRLAGVLINSRGGDGDLTAALRFAQAVGLPVTSRIPSSALFRRADAAGQTILEYAPESDLATVFRDLAGELLNGPTLHPARPLDEHALARLSHAELPPPAPGPRADCGRHGPPARPSPASSSLANRYLSKSMLFKEALHGCAFAGAVATTTQIAGAVTIAHGPRSCAHIARQTLLSSAIRADRVGSEVLAEQTAPALVSSDMTEAECVYGAIDKLAGAVADVAATAPQAIFLVNTCPAAIIGEDTARLIREREDGTLVRSVTADGNLAGDYMQGVINACLEGAASLIDPQVEPDERIVNVVAEKNIATNAERNFATVEGLLRQIGVGVHCRFVRRTSVDELRRFRRAGLNLLACEDQFGRMLRDFLQQAHGVSFATRPFPVGYLQTAEWLHEIGTFFAVPEQARALVPRLRERYEQRLSGLQAALAGRRLLIISYNHDVDWILEAAFDVGMEVVKVGILNYTQDHVFRTRYEHRFPVEIGYAPDKRAADILELKPDLVVSNYVARGLPDTCHYDAIPICPDVGSESGLDLAERWARILRAPLVEGWRKDAHDL